jgi:hypothetical protein
VRRASRTCSPRACPLTTCIAIALSGCIAVDADGTEDAVESAIALRVTDWVAVGTDVDAIPRRPRIEITAPAPWKEDAPESGAIVLMRGTAGVGLADDLERAPLRKEHSALVVESIVTVRHDVAWLVPRAALDPDAPYTLAIGQWAVDAARLPEQAPLPVTFALRTDGSPDAGAATLGSWPADGASGVGAGLAEVVVYFDGELMGADAALWLEGPDGLAVPANVRVESRRVALDAGEATHCATLVPRGGLAASARYAIRAGADLRDARGAPIGPWRATFTTGASVDRRRPSLVPLVCDLDETTLPWGCALMTERAASVRVRADEPARLWLRANGTRTERVSPRGDARFAIAALAPDTQVALEVAVRDAAGNEATFAGEIRTTPPLATLAITEVRANPRGAEPEQEFVEVWNYGQAPVDLVGFSLSDRGEAEGTPFTASAIIPPGARVLLVPDGFDARDALDAQPPPGAPLVRVGASLADSGLSNGGEPLFLRDPAGRRVSAAPATPRPRSGVCNVRVADDPRDGEEGTFAYAPDDGCSPGR